MDISNDDIAHVSLFCPDTEEEVIRHDLAITKNVNTTINRILDGNVINLTSKFILFNNQNT
jgi:hypothetical protein